VDAHALIDEITRLAEAIYAAGQRPALVELGRRQYEVLRTLYGQEFSLMHVRYEQPVESRRGRRGAPTAFRTLSDLTLRVVVVPQADYLRASAW
jgi:hypothetical protein